MNPQDQQFNQGQQPGPNQGFPQVQLGFNAPAPPSPQPQPGAPAQPTPAQPQPNIPPQSPPTQFQQPQAPQQQFPQQAGYQSQPGAQIPANPAGPQPQMAPAKPPVNPNSTQNVLQIAEIRDGIVIMNDGSFRSVIMVKSINFDLMSPQEREAVEFSYQAFLNSLYFPVQIFIRSQRVDIRPYIEKLDKIRTEHDNMLLAVLMDDYIGFIDQLSAHTNIMDKHFYIVVPYFPVEASTKPLAQSKGLMDGVFGMFSNTKTHVVIDETKLEAAKTELRNRVQAALSGLNEAGIQGLPLDTQELIELYYDTYNPDTATRQQLKNFNDLSAPIVTKGEGHARQPNLERELG